MDLFLSNIIIDILINPYILYHMETKKLISTLKGLKTRFTKNPNVELEKKSVEGLAESFGGKLETLAILKEQGCEELKEYVRGVFGMASSSKPMGKVVSVDEDGKEYACVNGKIYTIDTVKKTMKKVYKDFKDISLADLEVSDKDMPMTVYQRYLRDNFPNEDAPIKKGKLHFRGYRISCTAEDGFVVEDTMKKYAIVETPFEGIPTPKELGDWFKTPKNVIESLDEYHEAVERGKELARKAKEEKESKRNEEVEIDFEKLRRKVLRLIKDSRSKTIDVDPEKFVDIIPFKRWQRKVKSLFSLWKNRKLRYNKFLNEVEKITKEETFVIEEKKNKTTFVGTLLPEHKTVGSLKENKIEVDGKWVDAVPFLLEYLLFYEKKAMYQIMRYAAGEITDIELIKNPIEVDKRIEYQKKALENTAHNAKVLCMVYAQVGIVAPHDLLFEADLEVGDRILLFDGGNFVTRTISSVDKGIVLGKDVGLLKLDKWIKLPKKSK